MCAISNGSGKLLLARDWLEDFLLVSVCVVGMLQHEFCRSGGGHGFANGMTKIPNSRSKGARLSSSKPTIAAGQLVKDVNCRAQKSNRDGKNLFPMRGETRHQARKWQLKMQEKTSIRRACSNQPPTHYNRHYRDHHEHMVEASVNEAADMSF
mmetsp:Transcript_6273/g.10071  ORF Transcript_6273/g.10071 Transcript_6273/m.10071 type:complete len:153 (-) Transcript_6273:27-485(-)